MLGMRMNIEKMMLSTTIFVLPWKISMSLPSAICGMMLNMMNATLLFTQWKRMPGRMERVR